MYSKEMKKTLKKLNKKRGFTLIELLAVIVILAIIALIATPIILNVIESSRVGAFKDSVYGIVNSANLYITEEEINSEVPYPVNFDFSENNGYPKGIKYKGTKMIYGIVSIADNGGVTITDLTDGRYCARGNYETFTVTKGDCRGILNPRMQFKSGITHANPVYNSTPGSTYKVSTDDVDVFDTTKDGLEIKVYKNYELIFTGEEYNVPTDIDENTDIYEIVYSKNGLEKLERTVAPTYTFVWTKEDLNNVRNDLSTRYLQMENIDLSSYSNWEPIPNNWDAVAGNLFMGTYNGNNKTVSNLTVSTTSIYHLAGLFSGIYGGTVKNLKMNNTNVTGLGEQGSIAGYALYGTIDNCSSVGGNVTGRLAGGLVGHARGAEITNSYTDISVGEDKNTAGGIVGSFYPYHYYKFENNFSKGDITGLAAGGIIGELGLNSDLGDYLIDNNFATGTITGTKAGGIIGTLNMQQAYVDADKRFTLRNSYYLNNAATGGIVGGVSNTFSAGQFFSVNNFYKSGNSAGPANAGISKTDAELKQQSTFAGFNFTDTWIMGPTSYPYPILKTIDYDW